MLYTKILNYKWIMFTEIVILNNLNYVMPSIYFDKFLIF